jgi:hypothetical protein
LSSEACRFLNRLFTPLYPFGPYKGLAFRGHDESSSSLNKGNLLELIGFLKDNNEEVRSTYDRGGLNCKMTSHKIQKDLARCYAEEVTEAIMGEIGDRNFSVLIDESRDVLVKEQMGVVLRLVADSLYLRCATVVLTLLLFYLNN